MTHIEIDDEDRARMEQTILLRDRMRAAHLRSLQRLGSYEREFLKVDPGCYDDIDRAILARLTWHYRRSFPESMRMRVNPADPIAREMEPIYG